MTLLLFLLNDEEEEDNVRDEKVRAAGEKARTVNDDDAARATARADFAMFMIPIGRYWLPSPDWCFEVVLAL